MDKNPEEYKKENNDSVCAVKHESDLLLKKMLTLDIGEDESTMIAKALSPKESSLNVADTICTMIAKALSPKESSLNVADTICDNIAVKCDSKLTTYQCAKCKKYLPSMFLLALHDRTHTGLDPSECGKCGKCFCFCF
uniref:C2H2-type domain-containing protein n=1 Tax=Clytia hemisphaerica TaxID=252671 RepID=A0A7M5XEE0_9CNID